MQTTYPHQTNNCQTLQTRYKRRIAITGHRPHKLGGYDNNIHLSLVEFLQSELEKAEADCVIGGMALGVDIAWAIAAINLNIPLIAAVPFKGQELRWPVQSQRRYHRVLAKATEIYYTNVRTSQSIGVVMKQRNEWMVNRCTILYSIWDGSAGGTRNCIEYATKVGVQNHNLWNKWNEYTSRLSTSRLGTL